MARRCETCHIPITSRATRCRNCWHRARTRRLHREHFVVRITVPDAPTLRTYPDQPAIIGAVNQPDWQRAVAWESRPQRWTTLRPAERRSA